MASLKSKLIDPTEETYKQMLHRELTDALVKPKVSRYFAIKKFIGFLYDELHAGLNYELIEDMPALDNLELNDWQKDEILGRITDAIKRRKNDLGIDLGKNELKK